MRTEPNPTTPAAAPESAAPVPSSAAGPVLADSLTVDVDGGALADALRILGNGTGGAGAGAVLAIWPAWDGPRVALCTSERDSTCTSPAAVVASVRGFDPRSEDPATPAPAGAFAALDRRTSQALAAALKGAPLGVKVTLTLGGIDMAEDPEPGPFGALARRVALAGPSGAAAIPTPLPWSALRHDVLAPLARALEVSQPSPGGALGFCHVALGPLARAVDAAGLAVARERTRYAMRLAILERGQALAGGAPALVATDGHRLHVARLPSSMAGGPEGAPLPGFPRWALGVAGRALAGRKGGEAEARWSSGPPILRIERPSGARVDVVPAAVPADAFPRYTAVIPDGRAPSWECDRDALVEALERARRQTPAEHNGVDVEPRGQALELRWPTGPGTEARASIPCTYAAPAPAGFTVNPEYLLDAVLALDHNAPRAVAERVAVHVNEPTSPVLVRDPRGPAIRDGGTGAVVMPITRERGA